MRPHDLMVFFDCTPQVPQMVDWQGAMQGGVEKSLIQETFLFSLYKTNMTTTNSQWISIFNSHLQLIGFLRMRKSTLHFERHVKIFTLISCIGVPANIISNIVTTGKERFHKQKKILVSSSVLERDSRKMWPFLVFESMSFCNSKESWKKQRNIAYGKMDRSCWQSE